MSHDQFSCILVVAGIHRHIRAAEPVEPSRDVDLAVEEHGVQAQHRDNEDICVTLAWQQAVNMLLRLETQLERF